MGKSYNRFNNRHNTKFVTNIENWDALKTTLTKAALATRKVSTRDKFCPERVVRVGEFTTQIRRAGSCGNLDRDIVHTMTASKLWDDVLEPRRNGCWTISDEVFNHFKMICEEILMSIKETDPIIIECDLAELDRQVEMATNLVKRAEQCNKDADEILEEFKELGKAMSE